jgi:hypothetical protein
VANAAPNNSKRIELSFLWENFQADHELSDPRNAIFLRLWDLITKMNARDGNTRISGKA